MLASNSSKTVGFQTTVVWTLNLYGSRSCCGSLCSGFQPFLQICPQHTVGWRRAWADDSSTINDPLASRKDFFVIFRSRLILLLIYIWSISSNKFQLAHSHLARNKHAIIDDMDTVLETELNMYIIEEFAFWLWTVLHKYLGK